MAHSRLAERLYGWAWTGLDLLFPPVCGGCGCRGTRWCGNCQVGTQVLTGPLCQQCGQPLSPTRPVLEVCPDCCANPKPYKALRSWAIFHGPLRTAIHRLKYVGDIGLGERLARPMVSLLKKTGWDLDLVVPVPAGRIRKQARGYNQAALLAFPLALSAGIPYQANGLDKARETRSQVGLSPAERRANVAAAFRADQVPVRMKSVLVVDDVTTTGATIEACGQALLEAGAWQVFGITLARAITNNDPIHP